MNAELGAIAPSCRYARRGSLLFDTATALRALKRDDPDRPALEAFIAGHYARIHGARIGHFAEHLIALGDRAQGWSAAVGFTPASSERLFVEHYLDLPIEASISARLGASVERAQIVEVGNLAASTAGGARQLIVRMTALLNQLGHTWVVFTATRALLNSFARLEIAPIVLGTADPARLPDGGENWGSYYGTCPQVMTANIPIGFIHLQSRYGNARVG
jgi:hypothetical protein